jgi:Protein of unknown function (DUF2934)
MTNPEPEATLPFEELMTNPTGERARPTRNEIGRLAYHLYEMRGRRDGHDLDDWLSAERKLAHHYG